MSSDLTSSGTEARWGKLGLSVNLGRAPAFCLGDMMWTMNSGSMAPLVKSYQRTFLTIVIVPSFTLIRPSPAPQLGNGMPTLPLVRPDDPY